MTKTTNTPQLSKRHFELFASILADCRSNPALLEFYDADSTFWRKLNMHFAARLSSTNSNFDLHLFVDACDPTGIDNKSNPIPTIKKNEERKSAAVALPDWERSKTTNKIIFIRGDYKVLLVKGPKEWPKNKAWALQCGTITLSYYTSAEDAMRAGNGFILPVRRLA